jgi:hypothetical protein
VQITYQKTWSLKLIKDIRDNSKPSGFVGYLYEDYALRNHGDQSTRTNPAAVFNAITSFHTPILELLCAPGGKEQIENLSAVLQTFDENVTKLVEASNLNHGGDLFIHGCSPELSNQQIFQMIAKEEIDPGTLYRFKDKNFPGIDGFGVDSDGRCELIQATISKSHSGLQITKLARDADGDAIALFLKELHATNVSSSQDVLANPEIKNSDVLASIIAYFYQKSVEASAKILYVVLHPFEKTPTIQTHRPKKLSEFLEKKFVRINVA